MKTTTFNEIPYLKSMVFCLSKVINDGYNDDFKATSKGLQSLTTDKFYAPDQVKVVNFFRFEGFSDPDNNAILYTIETNDGLKGTLIDAYGTYANALVVTFMQEVQHTGKGTTRH